MMERGGGGCCSPTAAAARQRCWAAFRVDPHFLPPRPSMEPLTHEQLVAWLAPDESAAAFLARTITEAFSSGVPVIDEHTQLRPGQMIEIVGPSGAGKSEMLLQVRRRGSPPRSRAACCVARRQAGRRQAAGQPAPPTPLARAQIIMHFLTMNSQPEDATQPAPASTCGAGPAAAVQPPAPAAAPLPHALLIDLEGKIDLIRLVLVRGRPSGCRTPLKRRCRQAVMPTAAELGGQQGRERKADPTVRVCVWRGGGGGIDAPAGAPWAATTHPVRRAPPAWRCSCCPCTPSGRA